MQRYIRLDVDLPEHPKLKRLEARLGENALSVLVRVWCFAAKYAPDGNLSRYPPGELATLLGCAGFCARGLKKRRGERG